MKQINHKEYPESIRSAFVEPVQAVVFRSITGQELCVNEPAVIRRNTYRYGLLHSYAGEPAVIRGNRKEWYKNGKLHREGGLPAFINGDEQEWWINGRPHREGDLPAIIKTGDKKIVPIDEDDE